MFSLDNTCRYWLHNKPVDKRKSFNGLRYGQNECCVKLNTHNYRDTEVVDNQLLDMMSPTEKWTVY